MRAIILALTLLIASTAPAFANHHAVKIVKQDTLGSFLTDTEGMTLYYFTKDGLNKSVCAGDCLVKWPPYYRETVAAKDGLKASDFGVLTRDDGKKQTTYKGKPLYYFFKDKQAGDALGQGINGVWYVVAP